MKRFLVVADPYGSRQPVLNRVARIAARIDTKIDVVGFVYEHVKSLPLEMSDEAVNGLQQNLIEKHKAAIERKLKELSATKGMKADVEVCWEKRVAEWVIERARQQEYDLVIKGGRRTETITHTPTDWQLLRGCPAPVLLIGEKRWKRGKHVLAAVDLGSRTRSKLELNYKVVAQANAMAQALGCELHVGYAVPFSRVLRDLDMLDARALRREGVRRGKAFRDSLSERGITINAMHVVTGAPEKALVNLAARNAAALVVLGCVGRKRLAGRVIGNTAERILDLMKGDVLAIKP